MVGPDLREYAVVLSASVPALERDPKYRRRYDLKTSKTDLEWPEDASYEINEAVKGLVRSVLRANGTLVFGGHPTITPLVAQVAAEHDAWIGSRKEPPFRRRSQVAIYQSAVFERDFTPHARLMRSLPYIDFHLTPAAPGEEFRGDPRAVPDSLSTMREAMLSRDDAVGMFCIGGMEGVEAEATSFVALPWRSRRDGKERIRQACLVATTGGASRLIARRIREKDEWEGRLGSIDETYLRENGLLPDPVAGGLPLTPYPVIMAACIRDLAAMIAREEH